MIIWLFEACARKFRVWIQDLVFVNSYNHGHDTGHCDTTIVEKLGL